MRSNREFEQLVFEKAEQIKAHDRHAKLVRMSVLPAAAAFVLLTAVGIHGFDKLNAVSNLSNAPAANDAVTQGAEYIADEDYSDEGYAVSEPQNYNDEAPLAEYDGMDAAESDAPKSADPISAASPQVQAVVLYGNDTAAVTGSAAEEIAEALENSPYSGEQGGDIRYRAFVSLSDGSRINYYFYDNYVKNADTGQCYVLTDEVRAALEEYLQIEFS